MPRVRDPHALLDEAIKPYHIHVSRKYLDLTRQKLELTRLPRDGLEPKSEEWWEPKPTVEPLIDFWLEHYSWRAEEEELNKHVPQFRTCITTSASPVPSRIHFIHARSLHSNAVPLVLIPPFPFTNLSLAHLIELFTNPADAESNQPFHLVIPSLPGLGFSDALPNNVPMIPTTANMLDILMKRLDYDYYLTSNSGPSANTPFEVDWRLADYLASHHHSCVGAHLINPPLKAPTFRESPSGWIKWKLARVFNVGALGYSSDDIAATQRDQTEQTAGSLCHPTALGFTAHGACEPNVLAYALCDSPAGLLLFMLMMIKMLDPGKDFSPAEVITMTQMTWLPGPEATMRFSAHCASSDDTRNHRVSTKPRVGITVFLGDGVAAQHEQIQAHSSQLRPATTKYICPAWGNSRYNVVSSSRISGRPGMLAWERPEVIATGAQLLAKKILSIDNRLKPTSQPETTLLEQIVVDGGGPALAETSGTTLQASTYSPAGSPGDLSPSVLTPMTPATERQRRPSLMRGSKIQSPPSKARPLQDVNEERSRVFEYSRHNEQQDFSDGSPNTVISIRDGR